MKVKRLLAWKYVIHFMLGESLYVLCQLGWRKQVTTAYGYILYADFSLSVEVPLGTFSLWVFLEIVLV
jgi:hypothetical protein